MDIAVITLILTSFTALAAVIGPIISSVINVKSGERTKRFEMYTPQVYAAVQRFTAAYAKFPRMKNYMASSDLHRATLSSQAVVAYSELSAAAYDVMSFLPNVEIQNQIASLLADLDGESYISKQNDVKFQELSASIALALVTEVSPNKKCESRKNKGKSSK